MPSYGNFYLPSGSKGWQREGETVTRICPSCGHQWEEPDERDMALPFRLALRHYGLRATDIDFVITDGRGNARLVIEATRCERVFSAKYFEVIDERRRSGTRGNTDDFLITGLARLLGVKAILVVFEPNIAEDDAYIWRRFVAEPGKWKKFHAPLWFANLKASTLGTTPPHNLESLPLALFP
jgi:hypothetical protein